MIEICKDIYLYVLFPIEHFLRGCQRAQRLHTREKPIRRKHRFENNRISCSANQFAYSTATGGPGFIFSRKCVALERLRSPTIR